MNFDLPFYAIALAIVDWILRIACLIYIPRGRRPSAATAWLLAIFIVPTLGILCFLLIGSPKLSRRRRAIQERIDKLIAQSIPHDDFHFQDLTPKEKARIAPTVTLAHKLAHLPAEDGNSITLHTDYDATLAALIHATNTAKHSVYLEFYIMALDAATQPLFDAMEAAVQRGVAVHVLFDPVGSRRYRGYRKLKRTLTSIGVRWHPLLPISIKPAHYNRPDLRNHRKLAIFDMETAFIGSNNLIDKHYERRDTIAYEELMAELRGPVVRQCAAIFAGDWYSETGETLTSKNPNKNTASPTNDGALVQLVPSGPSYPHANNLQVFVSLLYTAQKRVIITNPYFVPDEALLTAVIAACKRGVEVIVINSEAKDQWMVAHAQRSYYTELLRAGVKIYLHRAPTLLHAKHITIDDDIAVIGSSNMDIRSFMLIMECVMIAYDKPLVAKLRKIQNKNLSNSRQVHLSEWQKRGLAPQLLDGVARLTADLQ